jgi:hypothetical protein
MAFVVNQAYKANQQGGAVGGGGSIVAEHRRTGDYFRIESMQWTNNEMIRTPISPLALESELKEVVDDFVEVCT